MYRWFDSLMSKQVRVPLVLVGLLVGMMLGGGMFSPLGATAAERLFWVLSYGLFGALAGLVFDVYVRSAR